MSAGFGASWNAAVAEAAIQAEAVLEQRGLPLPPDGPDLVAFLEAIETAIAAQVDRLPLE